LLAIVATIVVVDAVWASVIHAELDTGAYGFLAVISFALFGGGIFYDRVRKDERLSTMLFGTAFLIALSTARWPRWSRGTLGRSNSCAGLRWR